MNWMFGNRPTNRVEQAHIIAPARTGEEVLAELTAIKDQARLGVHMWEYATAGKLPKDALRVMNDHPRVSEFRRQVGMPRMLSYSLIPSGGKEKPCSMILFRQNDHTAQYLGYLFDFRQDGPDRMILPRMEGATLASGSNNGTKKFRLDNYSHIPAIRAAKINLSKRALIEQAYGPEGGAITERQLDGLDEFSHEMRAGWARQGAVHNTVLMNEVLGVPKKQNMKAIVIPYNDKQLDTGERTEYDLEIRLNAAVAGLQHEQAGYPLPVVVYHTYGPKQGELSLVGHDHESLRAAGMEALGHLRRSYNYHPPEPMHSAIQRTLGVNITGKKHSHVEHYGCPPDDKMKNWRR